MHRQVYFSIYMAADWAQLQQGQGVPKAILTALLPG